MYWDMWYDRQRKTIGFSSCILRIVQFFYPMLIFTNNVYILLQSLPFVKAFFSVVFPAGSGNRLDHQSELGLPYNWDNRRSKLVFCIELFSSKTLYSTLEQQLHCMSLFFYIQLQYSVPVLKGGKISHILLNFLWKAHTLMEYSCRCL